MQNITKIKNYWKEIIFFGICLLFGGILSISLGQGTNEFDTYNYHIYAPWAFLNDRYTIDILPSGIRSYFNPILDLPYYFLYKYLWNYPKLVGFIQGFWYGATVFLAYKISTLFEYKNNLKNIVFRITATILAATSPVIMLLCGMAFNDLQIAVLILLSLYLYLKSIFEEEKNIFSLIFSGFILGGTLGLKLTSAPMIFGMFMASLCLIKLIKKPLKVFFIMSSGFLAGLLIINGYWYYKIWSVFKNPFFPYFNNIFHSPFGSESAIVKDTYTEVAPQNLFMFLFYPFVTFFDTNLKGFGSWMYYFRDIRIPLAAISICTLGIKEIYDFLHKKHTISNNKKIIYFLGLFVIFSYVFWLSIFPIARYILPIFVIGYIIILYTIFEIISLWSSKNIYIYSTVALLLICALGTRIDLKEYRVPFEKTIFEEIPNYIEKDSTVLIAGQEVSYVIPKLEKSAKYMYLVIPESINIKNKGIYTYKSTRTVDYYYSDYYKKYIKEYLKSNKTKKLYLLFCYKVNYEYPLYERSLYYYLGKDYKLDCHNLDYRTNICQIDY